MTSSETLGLGPSASLTGPTKRGGHAPAQHPCMYVQGQIGLDNKLQDAGMLGLSIVPLGDVKPQERPIGSLIPTKASFR